MKRVLLTFSRNLKLYFLQILAYFILKINNFRLFRAEVPSVNVNSIFLQCYKRKGIHVYRYLGQSKLLPFVAGFHCQVKCHLSVRKNILARVVNLFIYK